ncbi:unnamed protein product [Arabis nemorensis]|uniref:Oleosin n=1 Tax=Arabis nemorensis TaxID=586526 RepID=A0A565CJ06_9BRAS|nr:unnamed protein product [Arabis nemorensis]
MREELVQNANQPQSTQSMREGRLFSFLKTFSFIMPLLDLIKVVIASVASVALLGFAGLTLAVSTVGFLVSTPLFIIFSPILVPATVVTTLLATGLTAGSSIGVTALGLIIWLIKIHHGIRSRFGSSSSHVISIMIGLSIGWEYNQEKIHLRKELRPLQD